MRLQTFWNRPIHQNSLSAVWHNGGRSGAELATAITIATCLVCTRLSDDFLMGLTAMSVAALCLGYIVGGFSAILLRLLLCRIWRHLGYMGCVLLGICAASLTAYLLLRPAFDSLQYIDFTRRFSGGTTMAFFFLLSYLAFVVMGGRGAAKLYTMWSRNHSPVAPRG